MSEPLVLACDSLRKSYGKSPVVRGVSVSVGAGEVVGLLGPNGAGKTTTFYMLVGLIRPNSGAVSLGGRDITRLPMYKRARLGLGYLPQEASIFRQLTVEQNLMLVLEMNKTPKAQAKERINELLAEFHVEHLRKQKGQTLSGGERRRLEIARALAIDPKFMLLDEPFTGIDPLTIEELQGIIHKLKTRGIGILITDHNVNATLRITDRSYILVDGQIVSQGTPADVLADPLARKHYFGESFEL
ncbi:MAG: LPS export ABC transporter ATP-binding protein [Armatimonadetes bacterium]|nr:LPS export ABC transporter ATP-binding protein [Armatimonadota bacterium]